MWQQMTNLSMSVLFSSNISYPIHHRYFSKLKDEVPQELMNITDFIKSRII
jgi:hypothetical protein